MHSVDHAPEAEAKIVALHFDVARSGCQARYLRPKQPFKRLLFDPGWTAALAER